MAATPMSATTTTVPPPPTTTTAATILIPNLPDDIALQCIARIPIRHHKNLKLVSKSWLFTLQSPLLFTTRHCISAAEPLLYLLLRLPSSTSLHSFLLHPKSPKTLNSLPPIPSQPLGSSFVALGPKIYVIGGSINDVPSNSIWVFDSRSNKWEIGPKMRVGREFSAAGVISGKIYVIGGCLVDTWAKLTNWVEVFDPEIGSWGAVSCPIDLKEKWMHGSAIIGGRMFAMADRGGVVFDPVAPDWGGVSPVLDLGWRGRAAVVDGVLYCYDYLGKIRGYDVEEDLWRELKGVEEGLPRFLCGATMANLGGRLVVVWEGKENSGGKEMSVWCAEISVRKDEEDKGLWGSIVWSDVILSAPNGSSIVNCLAIEL